MELRSRKIEQQESLPYNGDFQELLVKISDWYAECCDIKMLKILFNDYINNFCELETASKPVELFNMLVGAGHLSNTDITLLCATIELTGHQGLLKEIKLPPYSRENVISKFSEYRSKLINFGLALAEEDIAKIGSLYKKTKRKKYIDSWSLIFDLEKFVILKDDDRVMKKFTEKLTRHHLHRALNALQPDNDLSRPKILLNGSQCKFNMLISGVIVVVFGILCLYNFTSPSESHKIDESTSRRSQDGINADFAKGIDGRTHLYPSDQNKWHQSFGEVKEFSLDDHGASDGIYADFDEGFDGWTHLYPSDQNKWHRSHGEIEGSGSYIYVESSATKQDVYLKSPSIPLTWVRGCLQFCYYMSGKSTQELYILKYHDDANHQYILTIRNDSCQWKHATVSFHTEEGYNLVFKGISDLGMVAVDNITISQGGC